MTVENKNTQLPLWQEASLDSFEKQGRIGKIQQKFVPEKVKVPPPTPDEAKEAAEERAEPYRRNR